MEGAPNVSVILPTYNERVTLELLHPNLIAALDGLRAEIIVVDDGSPDGTAGFVGELSKFAPYVLVERPGRLGLASAVLRGFEVARGEVVVVMDADGSHPAETIPRLVEPVLRGGAEFALASRWVRGGSAPGLVGTRRTISWAARLLAWPLTHVRDPMSGFFAFRRTILARAVLEPVGYKIGLEILVKCNPHPVVEVPFRFEARAAGESKLDRTQIASYVRHVERLYVWRASRSNRASSTR